MDESNNRPTKHQHNLLGAKKIDGKYHVPIEEVVRFLKRFALYRGKELATVMEKSMHDLTVNPVKQKGIPEIDTKKSFLKRLFD
jgi:hypothetical protein